MDDELDQLEAELKRLEPARVSPELTARIATEVAVVVPTVTARGRPERAPVIRWTWAVSLAAAAAVVAILVLRSRPHDTTARDQGVATTVAPARSGAELKPMADESVLISARDEGLVTLDDGTRARRERLQFVETITWKNPRTNASLTWSMPREEVRVVPISFQ